ncbi:MAG: AAA family ATPase [Spirochaetales bacterium]|nr:AAA family ATPase [Spirochaetales bacterium]
MKIKRIELKNFINFNDFEIEFSEDITRLVGANGSGKTTIGLTSILAAFKGIAERSKEGQITGSRYQFIGLNSKSADVVLTIIDTEQNNAEIKVKNHITKDANAIIFEAQNGYNLNEEKFSNILSLAFLSAKNFTSLSGKEQAIVLGIDTDELDNKIKDIKSQYTFINRDLKAIGEIQEIEKAERVSVSGLIKEKEFIDNFNKEQDDLEKKLEKARTIFRDLKNEEKDILEKLENLRTEINNQIVFMTKMDRPKERLPIDDVLEKIQNVETENNKAQAYEEYLSKKERKKQIETEISKNRTALALAEKEKISYIQSFKMPFGNLTVNENGELLLKGRPIKPEYFSKGELEIIVAKLHLATNPELKTRFIDDFELLDEDNQKDLLVKLTEAGFQVITAEVGKKKKGSNSFLLKESKLVDSY